MASVKLEHIYKVYTGGVKAVSDMTLDIKDGEFIVFVGPSGCGKSTTLRMIAGLEQISAGELYIGDQIVNDMEPKDRDIAMVFQNYALYPQMTVYENMAFGLRLRHIPNDVIQTKIMDAANILGLTEMLDRKPKAMSGGQRQRVALGRAILRDPKVMLLDEPLSNLDAKLRTSMRTEIAKLHQRLKTTFIYVTHDQTEAMTLGDKVVVMKKGTVQQFDTPKNLYNYPANKFVAGFIGTPQMNFFDGTVFREGDKVRITLDKSEKVLVADFKDFIKVNPNYLDGQKKVVMGVRCEHLVPCEEENENSLKVKVSRFEELGAEALIYGDIDINNTNYSTEGSGIIIKVATLPDDIKIGDIINVDVDMAHTYFFDAETEESIVPRIPLENVVEVSVKDHVLHILGQELALPEAMSNVENFESGDILIPNDAFIIGDSGLDCTVEKTETIGDKNLVHVNVNGRVLFFLSDVVYENGAQLKVDLDYARLTLRHMVKVQDKEGNEKEELVVNEPLRKFDEFHASFFNLKTALAHTDEAVGNSFTESREQRIASVSQHYDDLIAAKKQEFETMRETAIPEDFKNVMAIQDPVERETALKNLSNVKAEQAKVELAQYKADMDKSIALLKETKNSTLASLKAQRKVQIKEAKEKNNQVYANAKEQEIKSYKEFISINKDKEATKRRRDEYRMFMSTFSDQKTNALNNLIQGIDLNYDNEVSKVQSTYKRGINNAKTGYKERKAFYEEQINPIKALQDKENEAIAELEKQKEEAVKLAGNIFVFGVGNYYFLSNPSISGKLIQGLGTRVFSKQFLLEVPHDAYIISNNGIKGKVTDIANYGGEVYYHVSYVDEHEVKNDVYIKKGEEEHNIGDEVLIAFDITKCQITETGMGIRLY